MLYNIYKSLNMYYLLFIIYIYEYILIKMLFIKKKIKIK